MVQSSASLYDHVARNYAQGGGDRETIQEFHRVRSSMTRARLDHVPAIPHDINDVEYLDSDHRGRKHLFVYWPYIPSSSNANI
jgi:hypothetical protein